jgi:hypothetical protein
MKLLKFNFLYNYNYTSLSLKNQIYNQMFRITKHRMILIDNMYETKFLNIVDEVSGRKIYKKKVMYLDCLDQEFVFICPQKGSRDISVFEIKPDLDYLLRF